MSDPGGWAWQVAAAMRRRQWLAEESAKIEARIERLLLAMPPRPVAPATPQRFVPCSVCGGCCLEHGEGHALAAYACGVHDANLLTSHSVRVD